MGVGRRPTRDLRIEKPSFGLLVVEAEEWSWSTEFLQERTMPWFSKQNEVTRQRTVSPNARSVGELS